ncbi:MFS transporter [Raineya orbicola]|jgi:UMF1 family MFS transporter|uniref:Permeases of the major facilitator superfamily n=1 Tax=Raineya orbicola TaxID=2016530 RepID=A0A2N3I8X7_9BACT|nr:MFS transporter [Raineya orbicola]PKQ66740.1 Permeases of the major facilitator superfamily [Raineya orbicola]
MTTSFTKNNPRILNAWTMYDWANSAFSLVIASAVFPGYSESVARNADGSNIIAFWGLTFKNTVLFEYAASAAFLMIAFVSPILSAIADYSGKKKGFMQFFCVLGSLACLMLFFFKDINSLHWGVWGYMLGLIGYAGSIVFNNSYLPDIATEDKFDALSAKAFARGYIGSVILLIFSLAIIIFYKDLGWQDATLAPRISFAITGIWWLGFAQYSFYFLPKNVYQKQAHGAWLFNGFKELNFVWKKLKTLPYLKRFIVAFFFYNMALQTVMYLATFFAKEEISLEQQSLIIVVLIIQLVAVAGSYFFSKISEKKGNTFSLRIAVVIWIGICIWAYFVKSAMSFYALASVVGLVMGGIQSLSRSTYAKLMPETTDTTSFFSFYDATDKIATALGIFVYGFVHHLTGSMRNSVLALLVFFVVGLVVLWFIPSKNSYRQV